MQSSRCNQQWSQSPSRIFRSFSRSWFRVTCPFARKDKRPTMRLEKALPSVPLFLPEILVFWLDHLQLLNEWIFIFSMKCLNHKLFNDRWVIILILYVAEPLDAPSISYILPRFLIHNLWTGFHAILYSWESRPVSYPAIFAFGSGSVKSTTRLILILERFW